MEIRLAVLLFLISILLCHAKKSKVPRTIKKEKVPRLNTIGKGFKKQILGMPYGSEGLGGEPVGSINPEGLEGLGSDMQGYPTGMGAGAEPLGAYGLKNGPDVDRDVEVPQGNDEEGPEFGGSQGFARPLPYEGQEGDYFEGRNSMETNSPDALRMGAFNDVNQPNMQSYGNMGPGRQDGGFLNPKAEMGESMTNNLEAMDKANIQGDSEVGEIVRQAARGRSSNTFPMGPSTPTSNDASFTTNRNYQDENAPDEFRNFKTAGINPVEDMNTQHNMMDIGSKRTQHNMVEIGSKRTQHNMVEIGSKRTQHTMVEIGSKRTQHSMVEIGNKRRLKKIKSKEKKFKKFKTLSN